MDTLIDNPITQEKSASAIPLSKAVGNAIESYFSHVGDQEVTELYNMVLAEIEEPLLRKVMNHTRGNQSQAAILLGLSRGTLRKKLKLYDLL